MVNVGELFMPRRINVWCRLTKFNAQKNVQGGLALNSLIADVKRSLK